MADMLITQIPDEELDALDARAARLGVSRHTYVRNWITQESRRDTQQVTVADLERFAETFQDLKNDELMNKSWS